MRRIVTCGSLLALLCVLSACGKTASSPPGPKPVAVASKSGVEMMILPGGQFTMGSDGAAADEAPAHSVTVSPFVIDVYEVYQAQYAALQLPNGSHFKDPRRPAEMVRWSDAAAFCNERSKAEGLECCYDLDTYVCNFDANGYRLPTEAEWEYAARAGSTSAWCFGDAEAQLPAYANFAANARSKTELVGGKRANPWGLYDMYGNVMEWCNDVYQPKHDPSAALDPRGPAEGKNRVLRGGSWKSPAGLCTSSARASDNPGTTDACFANDRYGFRCVRRPSDQELAKLGLAAAGAAGK